MANENATARTPYSRANSSAGPSAYAIVANTSKSFESADRSLNVTQTAMSTMPDAARAGSATLVTELNNVDFRTMIGGPLQAAVDAQVASALATVNFIQKVGFTQASDPTQKPELVMVDFTHRKSGVDDAGAVVTKETFVKVPLLAMLPIPSLRIESVTIDFNAKLNSIERQDVKDTLGINAEVGAQLGPVNFKVSASYQRQSSTGIEIKREYALNVSVKAVQDEMPAGLERILGMLAS